MTKSFLVLFLLIAASTESLSLFGAITSHSIRVIWVIFGIISLALMSFLLTRVSLRSALNGGRGLKQLTGVDGLSVLLLSCVLSITLFVALQYPPNNWDSMTYHMARVVHWIQNGSIDVFPTPNDRQTHNPPLAEVAILHLQLLGSSDRLANIVQWFTFLVSIVFVTLIAREFQLEPGAQLFSAVVAATIPMAILESSSTQNDLVVTSFCLGFTYFLLRFVRTLSFQDAMFCAMAMGLALLTKGTAYLYCCAIGLLIVIYSFTSVIQPKPVVWLSRLGIIVIAALVLNVGHLSRTYLVYGFNPTSQTNLLNDELSATITFSNIVRNSALHIGTPFEAVNNLSFRVVKKLLGDQLNDPQSTLGTTTVSAPFYSLHEDYAGNPVHLVLVALAFLIMPFARLPNKQLIYSYAGLLVFGALLYCGILKWHPWATRLHTPLFMLSAPFIAAVFFGFPTFKKWVAISAIMLLFSYSIPFVIQNKTRSFVALATTSFSHESEPYKAYFVNRPELYDDYTASAKLIMAEGAEEVGLCLGYDDYEYPLFVLMGRHASRGTPKFRHVGIEDASKKKAVEGLPPPTLVFATKRPDEEPLHGKGRQSDSPCVKHQYSVILESPNVRVWKRIPS